MLHLDHWGILSHRARQSSGLFPHVLFCGWRSLALRTATVFISLLRLLPPPVFPHSGQGVLLKCKPDPVIPWLNTFQNIPHVVRLFQTSSYGPQGPRWAAFCPSSHPLPSAQCLLATLTSQCFRGTSHNYVCFGSVRLLLISPTSLDARWGQTMYFVHRSNT